jgi:hypothetical protein
MSDPPLATFQFLPWVRRGLSAVLANPDTAGTDPPARAQLPVQLIVTALRSGSVVSSQPAGVTAMLYGPGDVVGVDPRHVIRTEPRDMTPNFEANYFAAIEFDHPDFPWMFTPAAPAGVKLPLGSPPAATGPGGGRLRPWISLVVLKDSEYTEPNDPPIPLPVINVASAAALSDLRDSWAWAHAHLSGDLPSGGWAQLLAEQPERAISRLICPRRLEPDTSYSAFLVPAFEPGRLAGLGQDPASSAQASPAWPPGGAGPVQLPVYYRFRFQTADAGDFESLVRKLVPRSMPPEVGIRPMDVSQPAQDGFPGAGPPLGLGGALRSPQTADTPWHDPDKTAFQRALQELINQTSPFLDDPDHPAPEDPKVVPPIYGRWHAGVPAVDRTGTWWLPDLNLDPRTRSVAGFGTRVVVHDKTQLMAAAWAQVAGIEEANRRLRQGQVARGAMTATFTANLQVADPATLLTLTGPVLTKVRASPTTVHATLAASRLPPRAVSGPFRRITRPLGPIARRQARAAPGATPQPGRLVQRLNTGEVSPVPPLHPPGGMVSLDQVSGQLYPSWLPGWLRAMLPSLPWILWVLAVAVPLAVLLLIGLVAGAWALALAVAVVAAVVLAAAGAALVPAARRAALARDLSFARLTGARIDAVPPRPGFTIAAPGQPAAGGSGPGSGPGGGPGSGPGADSADAAAFRSGASALFTSLQSAPHDPPLPGGADLQQLRTALLTRLHPSVTVPARIAALVKIAPGLPWRPADPLEPIMAYPEFPQPMYEPLRDLSQDLMLPGLELIPPDILTLLETNEPFVEAYMVGLNHEMARYLLWENYPTDQRGSYFRQFWDVRSYVPGPGDPADPAQLAEKLRDIRPIHAWPHTSLLGGNGNRPDMQPGHLVLLVRGELLRRYPNAVIYACQAQWDGEDHPRILTDAERYPLFRGTLPPDLTFFGFDLTEAEARGGPRESGGAPGWFFVFQQQPSEPRFGLEPVPTDPVRSWAELSWDDFAFTAGPGGQVFAQPTTPPQHVELVITPDNSRDAANAWGVDAAQTAYITLRRPVRIAVHADLMLPRDS